MREKWYCANLNTVKVFWAPQPIIDVENINLRLWQEELLDIIKDNQMNDRKIIWIIGREGNKAKISLIAGDGLTLDREERMWKRQVDYCTVAKNESNSENDFIYLLL